MSTQQAVNDTNSTTGLRPAKSATFADRHIGPDSGGMATMLHLLDQPDLCRRSSVMSTR